MHIWGCPVYVLNPSLQSGKMIPRRDPRSKRGVFCGLSMVHSSDVPQVLNLITGSITTQFHVVFDNLFSTVHSIAREDVPPSHWDDLRLENTELITMDNLAQLSPEWLGEMDKNFDKVMVDRTNQVRSDLQTTTTQTSSSEQLFLPKPRFTREGVTSQLLVQHDTSTDQSRSSEGATSSERERDFTGRTQTSRGTEPWWAQT